MFTLRPNFDRACKALTEHNLSGNRLGDFKATLEKISIYIGDTYSHKMGMELMNRKDTVVPQPDEPEDDALKYAK